MNRRSGRLLACLLVLGLVSACQTPAVAPERFALEAAQAPSLVVRVKQARRVQAVVGDVDHLLVTVKAADGAEPTRRIAASEFSGSDASVTFGSLASGEATVEVRALSATDQVLGRASVQATVTPGLLTQVDVPLQLNPAYLQNPAPVQSPGELSLSASLQDGTFTPADWRLPFWEPLVDVDFQVPYIPGISGWSPFRTVSADADGGILVTMEEAALYAKANGEKVVYTHYSPEGGVVDSQGDVWLLAGGFGPQDARRVTKYPSVLPPDSDYVSIPSIEVSLPGDPVRDGIAIDADDQLWVSNGDQVSKIAPDGQVLGHFAVGGKAGQLEVHKASGEVWVIVDSAELVRLATDGSVLHRTSAAILPGDEMVDLAVAEDGHVWVVQRCGNRVVKLAPDGTLSAVHQAGGFPGAVTVDRDGNAFVHTTYGILRFGADGSVSRHEMSQPWHAWENCAFERPNLDMTVDGDGVVWLLYEWFLPDGQNWLYQFREAP